MNFSKEELLQKHIEFELSLIQETNIQKTILDEVTFFYEEIESKKLFEIISKEQLEEKILQLLEKIDFNEEVLKIAESGFENLIKHLPKDSSSLASFLDKNSFQDLVYALLEFKETRNKLVHFIVNSPAYSKMISNIIYSSIKDFLVTQNPLTKNNPFGSSILKIGQDLLNSLPGMEGNFDKKITEFIEKNLSGRIQESENFILNELDSENAKEILQEFWKFLENTSLEEVTSKLSSNNIKKVIRTLPGFWRHLKNQKISEKYTKGILNKIHSNYSEKKISELISDLGLSKESLVNFISENLSLILNNDSFRTHYKNFITRRLKMFYDTL